MRESNKELKNCPFCDGRPTMTINSSLEGATSKLICIDCGMSTPWAEEHARGKLVKMWNRRDGEQVDLSVGFPSQDVPMYNHEFWTGVDDVFKLSTYCRITTPLNWEEWSGDTDCFWRKDYELITSNEVKEE